MALPLVAAGAAAAGGAGTVGGLIFAAGAVLKLRQSANQFRGAPRPLPPVTGREGEMTLEQMIQDAWAGARLPVGFVPPPPQGQDPKNAAGQAAAAAAGIWSAWQRFRQKAGQVVSEAGSIWNALNRPRQADVVSPIPGLSPGQTLTGNLSPRFVRYWVIGKSTDRDGTTVEKIGQFIGASSQTFNYNEMRASGATMQEGRTDEQPILGKDYLIAQINGTDSHGESGWVRYFCQFIPGTGSMRVVPAEGNESGWQAIGNVKPPTAARPEALPQFKPINSVPPAPGGKTAGSLFPEPPPKTAPDGEPIWAPAPGTGGVREDDAWKAPNPLVPGTIDGGRWIRDDGTLNRPQIAPTPAYVPIYVPVWVPTTLPGTMPAQPATKPATTPGHVHIVNGTEIAGGTARATLAAIAAELQRVEEKSARILENTAKNAGNAIDLGDILGLLKDLLDIIAGQRQGGTFEIYGPCETDADGNRLRLEAPFEGGYVIDQMNSKLDAVAMLLQHHKDLKQPICEQAPPPRSNVTVQFTELL